MRQAAGSSRGGGPGEAAAGALLQNFSAAGDQEKTVSYLKSSDAGSLSNEYWIF